MRAALLAALAGTGGLLAACQPAGADAGGLPAPSGTGSATVAGSVPASPTGAVPVSTSPGEVPTSSAAMPRCRRPIARVSVGHWDAGSGHRSVALVFTNTGAQPCRLSGYPGVAGLDAAGSQVAQARRTLHGYLGGLSAGSPPVLTLAPGESASALVEALAFNASDGSACTAFGGLLVTVPDDTASTRLPWDSDGCSDLQVHPVVSGTTGRSG
jgi:hypothetical protein